MMKVFLTQYLKDKAAKVLTSAQLTEFFQDIDVPLPPDKKICLATDVCIDGIGDLIHQIRAFEVLNKLYPGQIVCYTFCGPGHLSEVMSTANEYQFQTVYDPDEKNENQFALVIHVSNQLRWNTAHLKSFTLYEIFHSSLISGNKAYMGLSPHGVGMWCDNIPKPSDPSALLFASPALMKMFGCDEITEKEELKNWLDHAWIAQSFQYSEQMFKMTLLAQLEYIKIKNLPIEHFLMKFFGKERFNIEQGDEPWNMEAMMTDEQFVKILSDLNVKTMIVDGKKYPINDTNTLEVKLTRERISREDYPVFQQLINGAVFPSGDNAYSEAWSNPNTRLPAFLELRSYKQHLLFGLQAVVKAMELDDDSRTQLLSLIELNIRTVLDNNNKKLKGIAEAHKLAQAWSQLDSPQTVWKAVYEKLKEQDLAKCLPAMIEEQLLFALHPELSEAKNSLLEHYLPEKEAREAIETYLNQIEQALESDKKSALKSK